MTKLKFPHIAVLFAAFMFCAGPLALPLAITGCATTQQAKTYKTLYTLEQTTTAAVDAYYLLAIQGKVSTNQVPNVSKAFDAFQKSMQVAIELAQNNTNAIAPAYLVQQSTEIITLISQIK